MKYLITVVVPVCVCHVFVSETDDTVGCELVVATGDDNHCDYKFPSQKSMITKFQWFCRATSYTRLQINCPIMCWSAERYTKLLVVSTKAEFGAKASNAKLKYTNETQMPQIHPNPFGSQWSKSASNYILPNTKWTFNNSAANGRTTNWIHNYRKVFIKLLTITYFWLNKIAQLKAKAELAGIGRHGEHSRVVFQRECISTPQTFSACQEGGGAKEAVVLSTALRLRAIGNESLNAYLGLDSNITVERIFRCCSKSIFLDFTLTLLVKQSRISFGELVCYRFSEGKHTHTHTNSRAGIMRWRLQSEIRYKQSHRISSEYFSQRFLIGWNGKGCDEDDYDIIVGNSRDSITKLRSRGYNNRIYDFQHNRIRHSDKVADNDRWFTVLKIAKQINSLHRHTKVRTITLSNINLVFYFFINFIRKNNFLLTGSNCTIWMQNLEIARLQTVQWTMYVPNGIFGVYQLANDDDNECRQTFWHIRRDKCQSFWMSANASMRCTEIVRGRQRRPSEVDVFTDKVISKQTQAQTEASAHTHSRARTSFDEQFCGGQWALGMKWMFHNAIPCGGQSVYWSTAECDFCVHFCERMVKTSARLWRWWCWCWWRSNTECKQMRRKLFMLSACIWHSGLTHAHRMRHSDDAHRTILFTSWNWFKTCEWIVVKI